MEMAYRKNYYMNVNVRTHYIYFIILLPFLLSRVLGSSLFDMGVDGWLTLRVGFGCSSNSSSLASSVLWPGFAISFLLSLIQILFNTTCPKKVIGICKDKEMMILPNNSYYFQCIKLVLVLHIVLAFNQS